MEKTIHTLATRLGEMLLQGNATVTCAESCTGGGIASAITDVPGSSSWFRLGLITYANSAKQQLLGVSAQTLAEQGAVSEAVVVEMARGALALAGADIAVAVSGIAGPDGGTPDRPVGTVWFCWASRSGDRVTRCLHFDGDRGAVRAASVLQALTGLINLLDN
ncbi:CinA family protein [Porticoccus sp.]